MARGTAKSKSSGRKTVSYTKWGYIFVAPFVVVYLIFSLYPLLNTFIFSAANMTSTTSDFWGFSNKEIYYDRYLDLTTLYSENFDERTGVDSVAYKRVREYFDTFQMNAEKYNPLKKSGINAIVEYAKKPASNDTPYSVEAANAVQSAYDNQDFSLIVPYYDELMDWSSNYKNETLLNIATLRGVNDACTKISEAEVGDSAKTSEDVLTSDNFVNFVDSLESSEFNAAQTALLDYLSTYITDKMGSDYTVASFFKAVQDGTVSLDEPTVYYVCYTLNKTDIDFAEEDAEESISSKIEVPFMSDLESFLTANSWKEAINSLTSVSRFDSYINGEKDLHSDEDQLITDLKTLNDMGIIHLVTLVKDGDSIVESSDYLTNKIIAFEKYRDEKTVDNELGSLAAMQLSDIQRFYNATERMVSKFEDQGINIYSLIGYDGELDIERYKQVKSALGLNESLSLSAYENLDKIRKAEAVDKAKADLAEQEANLATVKADYEATLATGDEDAIEKAYSKLREVEIAIDNDNDTIKNPDGILVKAEARQQYVMIGLDNYASIFMNKTRFNMVSGALVATAILWLIGFAPQILLALILSAWFTDTKIKLRGLNLMKALMYLPNVITAVTVAIFFRGIFQYSTSGTLSASQIFLRALGMEKGYNFFDNAWATRFIVAFINFWMWYGNTMITLIAGISSISESLYEAAQIDGANSFQTYTKITMPLLRPMLLYTMVTSMIGGLQMFDVPQNINRNSKLINFNGTMIPSIRTIMMYINSQAFSTQTKQQVGVGSAVAVLLFILTTVLSIIIFYLMRDKDVAKAKKLAKQAKKEGK